MTHKLSPIVSEFETQEQAESYDRWFRDKVETAINSKAPNSPHDEVIAGAKKMIEQVKARRKLA
ncbi:type II toxin-antitoxin system RelB family antitoxin [Erwinia aphidicola]|uniref:type II toxin-antitoxin system RelB family antitoxin n=1 Tax=Erwinia aphidicola TaxID=68334 RepID=UPI003D1CA879